MNQLVRFVVLFVVVSVVLFFGVWLFVKSWAGSLKNVSIGGLETLAPVLQTDVLKEVGMAEKKEFVSVDGKLRVPYPAGWLEFPREQLPTVFPAATETTTPLFLLQRIDSSDFAQFFGMKIKLNIETFDQFLEVATQDIKGHGWKMESVSAQPDELGGMFESRYSIPGGETFLAKERVIIEKGAVYLFSFFAREASWKKTTPDADSIFSAIQYTEE